MKSARVNFATMIVFFVFELIKTVLVDQLARIIKIKFSNSQKIGAAILSSSATSVLARVFKMKTFFVRFEIILSIASAIGWLVLINFQTPVFLCSESRAVSGLPDIFCQHNTQGSPLDSLPYFLENWSPTIIRCQSKFRIVHSNYFGLNVQV